MNNKIFFIRIKLSNCSVGVSSLHQIPCVPKTCVSPDNLIKDVKVKNTSSTEIEMSCDQAGYLLGGQFLTYRSKVTASCVTRDNKLPAWTTDNVALPDSADLQCRDPHLCYKSPESFNNKILLDDFDGEGHYNGTKFSLFCPSNVSGE